MTLAMKQINLRRGVYLSIVRSDRLSDGRLWYVAEHPTLPGCMSDGATPEEALANLDDAREMYINSMLEDGLAVPAPNVATEETSATIGTRRSSSSHVVMKRLRLRRDDSSSRTESDIAAYTVAS